MTNKRSEKGNAVIFILLAIALFAALAYTFTRSVQNGQSNMSAGQTRMAAQQILNYASSVEKTVQKLLSRGCSENDLSFQNSYETYHNYPAAPTECRVFDPAGGNLTALKPEASWLMPGEEQVFYYTQGDVLSDIGTTCDTGACAELNLNLWNIPLPLCEEINKQLGLNFTTIPTGMLWGCPFSDGTFNCNDTNLPTKFNTPELKGVRAVCYFDTNYNYVFNYVLLER